MKRYFGTDGIRGIANEDLTPELVFRIGRAAASVLGNGDHDTIIVGKDPRLSSDMLEGALASGILSTGVDVLSTGIIPTPAVSVLTRHEGGAAGIMISASHNPIEHNGIKIFGKNGLKLSDEEEREIELHLRSRKDTIRRATGRSVGQIRPFPTARDHYLTRLKSTFPHSLNGLHLVLDCAHGATSHVAPELFVSLGAKVTAHGAVPDGSRINLDCGATHLDNIRKLTLEERGDIGIAFDGDGDRVMLVDRNGEIFNGDRILAALALHWKKNGKLREPVVTTVMANFGLEKALKSAKIRMVRVNVGDRYVLEEMMDVKANLGGEQSGHVILLDYGWTGDGCLTALQLLAVILESGKSLEELKNLVTDFPQILVNVPASDPKRYKKDAEIQNAIHAEAAGLKGKGRILVRPSGTEPLIRVMAEGPDRSELEEVVQRVVKVIRSQMG